MTTAERMHLRVRYFASIREALGSGEALTVDGGTSVGAVRGLLTDRGGAHAAALAPGRNLRCALNQVLCDESAVVADGDELAFFPPVTGG